MAEFKEFYVACNPPLLHQGVARVILLVTSSVPDDRLQEILYEPDIAWFKVIALSAYEAQIIECFETFIHDIYTEEGADVGNDGNNGLRDSVPSKNFCSWPSYFESHKNGSDFSQYREYMIPESLQEYSYCDIFRGLQDTDAARFDDLLSKLGSTLIDPRLPKDFDQLQKSMKTVRIEHNMRQNLLYIASNHSSTSVKMAKERLQNLVDAYSNISLPNPQTAQSDHVIMAIEGPDNRFKLISLKDLGLATKTFCSQTQSRQLQGAQYKRIMQSQAMWKLVKNDCGEWKACEPLKMETGICPRYESFGFESVKPRELDQFHTPRTRTPFTYRLMAYPRGESPPSLVPAKRERIESSNGSEVDEGTGPPLTRDSPGEETGLNQVKAEPSDEAGMISAPGFNPTDVDGNDLALSSILGSAVDPAVDASSGDIDEGAEKKDAMTEAEHKLSTLILHVEKSFVRFTGIVPIMRGMIGIRVQLGRIYLNCELKDINENHPLTMETATYILQHEISDSRYFGFSSILSTLVEEGGQLRNMTPAPGARWDFVGTKISYIVIVRTTVPSHEHVEIEINASSMNHRAVGRRNDFFFVYMHKVENTWDARLHGYNTYSVEEFGELGSLAIRVVGSLKVTNTRQLESTVTLEFADLYQQGYYIDSVTIKKTLMYALSADTDIRLHVARHQKMERQRGMIRPSRSAHGGNTTSWSLPRRSAEAGTVWSWIEAEIRSNAIDGALKENLDIGEYGEKTNWSGEKLCQDGRVRAMCAAAAGMLTQMDGIGDRNDNQFAVEPESQAPPTVTVRPSSRR